MNGIKNLYLDSRRKVYNYILKHPGLHVREISRKMNIPKTTLTYHLDYLKKSGLIIGKNDGIFLRYFVKNKIGGIDKEFFALIRKRLVRHIILVLAYYRVCTQIEIVKHLKNDFNIKKDPTTVAYHLDKLIEMGIIEGISNGREKIYLGNYRTAHLIIDFVTRNKMSFLGDTIIWHLNRLNKPSTERFEKIEEVIYEIFPHPYHV